MSAGTIKQISADSDTSNSPYVAYLTGGNSGTLKVATWTNTGTFQTFETADNTKSHTLPSITIPRDNIVRIYTISGGRIYETKRINGVWQAPADAFGITTSFDSPNELTAGIKSNAGLWEEGTAFNVMFGTTIINPYTAIGKHYPSLTVSVPTVANRFVGYNDFKGTSASSLSSDLLSIISVAGVNTNNPPSDQLTNILYQQAIRVANDDTVRADPQVLNTAPGGNLLMGCFVTNNCFILSSIGNLDYVYQTFYWNNTRNQIQFYSEGHHIGGGVAYNLTTYNKPSQDTSNGFALGYDDQKGLRTPQLGVESDIETYGWQVKQYNWQYYPDGGNVTDFSSQAFELVRSSDPYPYNSEITPSSRVGTSPYDVQGDFTCNDSSVPSGTIIWSHATSAGSIVGDGKVPWSAQNILCN
jgi:hypothetical protein